MRGAVSLGIVADCAGGTAGGAAGAATGQGKAASAALEGIARNPTAKNEVFQPLIISLAFMEFQALMSFVVAILLTFK